MGKSNKKYTRLDFIWKAQAVHYGFYDYSKVVYVNARTKVEIICPTHGPFWQLPSEHLSKKGCPKCGVTRYSNRRRSNSYLFIQKAKLIHGDLCDYSKVIYIDNRTNVEIICPIHGSFWQTPTNHLSGKKCMKCVRQDKTTEQIIKEFILAHGDEYGYGKLKYTNVKTKVIISCLRCDVDFKQRPKDHLRGSGCPNCASSRGEKLISKLLRKNRIKFETQWHFNKHKNLNTINKSAYLKFDFYLPDYNLCIEYDGIQHFKPIDHFGGIHGLLQRQINDQVKNQFCLDNNIRLLRIPYWMKLTSNFLFI